MSSCGVSFIHEFGVVNDYFLSGSHVAGFTVVEEHILFLKCLFDHSHFLLCEGVVPAVSLFEWSGFTVFECNQFTLTRKYSWQNCLFFFFNLIGTHIVITIPYRVELLINRFDTIECCILILSQKARYSILRRFHMELLIISLINIVAVVSSGDIVLELCDIGVFINGFDWVGLCYLRFLIKRVMLIPYWMSRFVKIFSSFMFFFSRTWHQTSMLCLSMDRLFLWHCISARSSYIICCVHFFGDFEILLLTFSWFFGGSLFTCHSFLRLNLKEIKRFQLDVSIMLSYLLGCNRLFRHTFVSLGLSETIYGSVSLYFIHLFLIWSVMWGAKIHFIWFLNLFFSLWLFGFLLFFYLIFRRLFRTFVVVHLAL